MSQSPPPRSLLGTLRMVGPGLVVAATGVGAGDMVAAAKAGAIYGLPLLWTVVLGALIKFVLAEGVARWQLATGKTVLEGWMTLLGRPVQFLFLAYLLVWTYIVAAALMSACGLAAHALFPQLSVNTWAILHALAGLAFVWRGTYGVFESAMKWAIGLMFVAIVGSALLQTPAPNEVLRGFLVPSLPAGSTIFVLGIIGGIGGTITLLSYNYWLREKGWSGPDWMRGARVDLGVGYLLTGIFGIAIILLGGMVLLPRGISISGSKGVLEMAVILGERFGRPGEYVFIIGFWGAVATSLLGVWQGVPYLFGNYLGLMRGADPASMSRFTDTRSGYYRAYVLFMTFPPMLLLLIGKPVWLVIAYAALGALFMPFLAGTLLAMNNRRELGALRNGWIANAGLILSLLLFAWLALDRLRLELMKLIA
jgi:Mn2+/Fe2+ NRAMP family transporter